MTSVVRYTVSGTLDTTFGTGVVVTTPVGPGGGRAYGVAIQRDGKIVAAGWAESDSDWDFVVVRYTAPGTLDTTFGTGVVVTTSIGPGDNLARSVAIQPDGKIVGGDLYSTAATADDPLAVISQHLHAPVVPPRAKNAQIPPALDALMSTC